jgi:putative alpha-1,2-mannosidase
MSACHVFAAWGVYPANPAVEGFALDSPLFPSATIRPGNGKTIKIEGENAYTTNPYIQTLRVNGKPSKHTWVSYDTWNQGATL